MTTVNFYSKEQTDAKLEHVATKITDKDEYYEINSTSAITAGADVPVPTIQDAGKFLKVGDNADLIYGDSDDTIVKSRIFTDATSLYNFLSDTFGNEPKYIVSLIRYFNMPGVFFNATSCSKVFNSDNFRINIALGMSMSSDNTDFCSFETNDTELLVSEDNVEAKVMQTHIEIENTSSTKDIHHSYYETPSSSTIGNDYRIEILYTDVKSPETQP